MTGLRVANSAMRFPLRAVRYIDGLGNDGLGNAAKPGSTVSVSFAGIWLCGASTVAVRQNSIVSGAD